MSQELFHVANGDPSDPSTQRAQMAIQIEDAFRRGEMSEDERRALLEDLIRTDQLEAEAGSLQNKQMLVFGVTQLIQMV